MDFIERLFGVSPDGGSGVLEALFVLVPLAMVGVLVMRVRSRSRSRE
jgi:hypothetical protein